MIVRDKRRPRLWVTAVSDGQGTFEVPLPVGAYTLSTATGPGGKQVVELAAGQTDEALLLVQPPQGVRVKTGAGRRNLARQGVRRGAWQSWGAVDGLAHSIVSALAPGRRGSLWLGTGNGLSHFDGTYFTNYSAEDGLLGGQVTALGREAGDAGALWIGTPNGLSRFDGTYFTNFSSIDSMPNDKINYLAVATNNI